MANWRDKNQNMTRHIGSGYAPQVTGITAAQYVTLNDGSTGVTIPAGTLSVGDMLHLRLFVEADYTAGTWNLETYVDDARATYLIRQGMATDRTFDYDFVAVVESATKLAFAVRNPTPYGATNLTANASEDTSIDITTDINLRFYIVANGTSASNTLDIRHYTLEILKGS